MFSSKGLLTLYLVCLFLALPMQQQKRYDVKNMDKWDTIIRFGRKHCGKEEIARYEQFLLVPQCFQKVSGVDAPK